MDLKCDDCQIILERFERCVELQFGTLLACVNDSPRALFNAALLPLDGIHFSDTVLKLDTQILLNMYCNNHMNYNDGTCCSDGEPVTVLQIITGSWLNSEW